MIYIFTFAAMVCMCCSVCAQSLESQTISLLSPAVAQPTNVRKTVGFDHSRLKYTDMAIEKAVHENKIPGAVLAVVRGDKLEYLKAYGNRALYPSVEPMTENTIFDIASCSKPTVTAVAAMILIDQGRLSLHDDLNIYFPNFNKHSFDGKYSSRIRVRHLMTHTSGLTDYVAPQKLAQTYDELNRKNLIDYISKSNRFAAPNTAFKYSCLNYILLQDIIEQITGESLRDFAKRNIFDVLGMKDTDYIPLDAENQKIKGESPLDLSRIAPTEYSKTDGCYLRGVVHDPLARLVNNGVSGNSGVFSTASDLAILMMALLNDGEYHGKRILSPLAARAMRNIPRGAEELGRSLGWDVFSSYSSNKGDLLSRESICHTGFTGTSITVDAENDIAIILLTNYVHQKRHSATDIVHLRAVVANSVASAVRP